MAREDFEGQGGAGGAFAIYDFEVTDAKFEVVPEYMDGNTLFLHWVGNSTVEGYEVMTMEGYHPSFALSKDWTTVDNGKSIQYQGKSRKPKYGKRYGMMVDKVLEITEHLANTPQDPLAIIDPKQAATWIGTKWTLERVEVDYKGNIGVVEVELPTAYLGQSGTGQSAPPQPQAQPQNAAAVPPQAQPAQGNGDPRAAVVALAVASGDFDTFRAQALNIPGVTADPALVQEVLDQNNGIFAQAKA